MALFKSTHPNFRRLTLPDALDTPPACFRYDHKSALDRKLDLYSERAFYYSYYETVIRAPTTLDVYQQLLNDSSVEHPTPINALSRFNIYPELVLGLFYRLFGTYLPISAHDLMMAVSFILAGIQWAGFAYLAVIVTENPLNGILAMALCCMHADTMTRADMLMLRENFALPFFWWQVAALLRYLGDVDKTWRSTFVGTTIAMLCSWQFTPMLLLLELVAVFAAYCTNVALPAHVILAVDAMSEAAVIGVLMMLGNSMIAGSLWVLALATTWLVLRYLPSDLNTLHNIMQGAIIACATLAIKKLLSLTFNRDDSHIFTILEALLAEDYDLLTALYVCSAAYIPITPSQLSAYWDSGLVPLAALGATIVILMALLYQYVGQHTPLMETTIATALCLVLICLGLGIQRHENLKSHALTDTNMRALVKYLRKAVPANHTILSDPVLSSSIKLLTRHHIVLHPHAESASVHQRYQDVFQIVAPISEQQAANLMEKYDAQWMVLAQGPCELTCPSGMPLSYYATQPSHLNNYRSVPAPTVMLSGHGVS
ncbi:uncharacterized protein MONBRDRAFT_38470 [Monosiga brevicollis MX1]|uniref:Uncharacterized protein n=1 Tax=Monosiga brevicollis TaxID=81824 RepID=A9V807_MONBE|nr:uncharacterized protein MONBRDRAFT_38470 [Monosiga brevicollis MX1]EDQ86396.1 predicted protein [Monosiga brevicollis MX1]|eukprot:XP_001748786.1 hypothetical protein [Monosiga brevicollis MX1]